LEHILDYESITRSVIGKVPNGVGGVNWRNAIVVNNEMYGGEGYINTTVSGQYVVYGTSGYPIELSSNEPFDFVGAFVGVAWLAAEGERLEVRAWRGQELASHDELVLSALGPIWFDASYTGVTRVQLSTRHHWQLVMDDVRLRSAARE
jgi:hypothetical protein